MAAPAGASDLPPAGTKLRMVLDYVPCEACLAQPVDDQELLCTICARLDRQIAVRVATRTTILVERPTPPPAPIVIAPAPTPAAIVKPIVTRFAGDAAAPEGAIEVVVEPYAPPAAPLPPLLSPTPPPPVAPIPEEPEFSVDDIVSFVPARDEFFDYRRAAIAPLPPPRAPEPEPEPAIAAVVTPPPPEDDFVFRPPASEPEPERAVVEPEPAIEEIVPAEEIHVEPAAEVQRDLEDRWAPPSDFLADEPEPQPVYADPVAETYVEPEPEPVEMEIIEDEPEPVEMEILPDEEEIVEMEVVPDDEPTPAPSSESDLFRLRGFDLASGAALGKTGITDIASLAGHDAGELATRSGIAFERLLAWVQVADLVTEVGVPVEAATALVAAGIAGPRGLADADPDEVADRVAAFGGANVSARDIKRWKRRA